MNPTDEPKLAAHSASCRCSACGYGPPHIELRGKTVADLNATLGIDIWRVPSFRADVRIDFDEYGRVLNVVLLNPTDH